MNNNYLSDLEIGRMNFGHIGENVKLSRLSVYHNPENIYIGDNSRIDHFCVLSATKKIDIGKYVHIASYCSLVGAETITLGDYSGISSAVKIYSSSDDYGGDYMTNPCVPYQYRSVTNQIVSLGNHVVVGSGCVILPGVILFHGVSVAAMSLVKDSFDPDQIIGGVPAKFIKERNTGMYEKERELNGN